MRRTLIAVISVLMLGACGGGDAVVPQAGGPAATATAADTLPADALDFSLPDVNGGQVEGAALVGRDLALWFWAPW